MKDYEYLTKNLINDIKKSNEYNHYHRVLKKIMQDEEMYDTINKYRKKVLSLQMNQNEDSYQQMIDLGHEYEDALSNSIAKEFLIAEQRITKMSREIITMIINSLEIDIDFLN